MKNFKLLLATTAILSMGTSAINAAVDDPLTSEIVLNVLIMEPARIKGGIISFPTIITGSGRVVTVDASGNIVNDGAHATTATTYGVAGITPIYISGGDAGDLYQGAPASSLINNITITSPVTLTDISANDSGNCGTVDYFTPGSVVFEDVNMAETDEAVTSAVGIPYGATFTMDQDFHPTNGLANCQGSAEVTYIPYNF